MVMAVVVGFYFDVQRTSSAATARTRELRRATGLLDRVAHDLESAVLVKKPPEMDPLAHPWLFYAESSGFAEGANRLKFVTRGRIPRSTGVHESDLEMVAYVLGDDPRGGEGFALWRWSSPRLPEAQDLSLPGANSEGALLLADGIASFGVRFLDDAGQWQSSWNSTTLVDSSELPVAAEISVAFLPEESDPDATPEERGAAAIPLVRDVLIPVRPIDLEALITGKTTADTDQSKDCVTVSQCLARNADAFDSVLEAVPDLGSISDDCYRDHADQIPVALEGCEQ
jgi:hypothetical protein